MSYLDQITVGSTTYDLQDSGAQRETITGSGAPSTSTVGTVGLHYINTSATGHPYEYVCVSSTGSTYTWVPIDSADAPVTSVNNKTGAVVLTASDVGAGTYSKPSGGIPKTDLASAVQTSLGKADTSYQKPSTGIPATDLADGVIPSVPTAYTSDPEDLGTASPGTSNSWARGDHVHAKPTYSKSDVGLGNVDNVKQYSASNPPPYPVTSVNGSTGAVTVSVPSAATATPSDLGTAAVGTSTKWAKEDHVHKMPSASDIGAVPNTTIIVNDLQYNSTQKALRMSKNGSMSDVVTVSQLKSDMDLKTSDLTNDSGFVNATGAAAAAPVQSVNGKTGAVTVVEDDQTWNGVSLAKQSATNTGDSTYVPLATSLTPVNMSFTPVKKTPTANAIAKYDNSSYLYSTTPSDNDNSTKVATTAYVDSAIDDLPEPMVFKGSLGTGGTITTLPAASSSNTGFTYKVITAGTYASQAAKVGDTFISDGTAWVLIPSGDEPSGTVTSVGVSNATNGGLSVSGSPITSSGTISIGHSNVLTNAQTTQAVYPIKIDKNGHISAYGSAVSVPSKTSDLTNDSGFITSSSVPVAATATPANLGTAAVGTSTKYAREDHVHTKPTYSKSDVGLGNVDNVKQYSASNPPPYPVTSVNGSTGAVTVAVPSAATATPSNLGTAAVGTSTKYAKEDHVHNYPDVVHIGSTAPSDSNIELWLDSNSGGSSVVSSVDGKSGVVTVLPSGGTTGQVLKKVSGTSYDVTWANESGSVTSVNGQTGDVEISTVAVQDSAPTNGELVWIDTDDSGESITIPQIDDNSVSTDDTWSSSKIRDFIYPVGSIYMSVNSISPATIFGGTWEQIEDTFLLAAGSTYTAGDTGGKANYVADDMPKHSHTRGTMNITGEWSIDDNSGNAGLDAPNSGSGAIGAKNGTGYGSPNANDGSWKVTKGFTFNAANGWSGSTSEVGVNTTAEIMPPYLAVYMWKRTA